MDKDQTQAIITMIRENPAIRNYARAAVNASHERTAYSSVVDAMSEATVPKTCVFKPQTILDWMIEYKAVGLYTMVDGKEQSASFEDLQKDQSNNNSSSVGYEVQATEEGIDAIDKLDPYKLTVQLFAENPDDTHGFLKVLNRVKEGDGPSGQDIWDLLDGDEEALRYSKINGYPTVYPAYYSGALEDVDAIVWKDGGWYITEAGENYLLHISGYVGPFPHTTPNESQEEVQQ